MYHAVELEDVQLVNIFLDAGAESNMKKSLARVPLIKAVEKGNEELTELLVQRTDRVNCTLALGQAVRQRAMTIVNILLANGAKCDFEESDRPPPRPVIDLGGCTFGLKQRTPIDWFMPPLVYAVKLGNKDLARLYSPTVLMPTLAIMTCLAGGHLQGPAVDPYNWQWN